MKRVLLLLILGVGLLHAVTQISTDKNVYESDEDITVSVSEMSGVDDWIGIYEKSKNNEWENVVSWVWGNGVTDGDIIIVGGVNSDETKEYEARAFFNDNFDLKAKSTPFTVNKAVLNTTVQTAKDLYQQGEKINVSFSGMLGDDEDWIAIFPKDKDNSWENVVTWSWSDANKSGNILFSGIIAGDYEVRAFFKNGFVDVAKHSFSVTNEPIPPSIYEDGEDGSVARWSMQGGSTVVIKNDGFHSAKSVYMRAYWKKVNGVWVNTAHYQLTDINHANWNNTTQKILEFEHKTTGSPCFIFGVYVNTLLGERVMNWSMWYERQGMDPTKIVYEDGYTEIVYPYSDGMRYERNWTTHRFDLDLELKKVEPNNRILSVNSFYTTGGKNYDNIRLVSQ
jgi:hypothetical protein